MLGPIAIYFGRTTGFFFSLSSQQRSHIRKYPSRKRGRPPLPTTDVHTPRAPTRGHRRAQRPRALAPTHPRGPGRPSPAAALARSPQPENQLQAVVLGLLAPQRGPAEAAASSSEPVNPLGKSVLLHPPAGPAGSQGAAATEHPPRAPTARGRDVPGPGPWQLWADSGKAERWRQMGVSELSPRDPGVPRRKNLGVSGH